jgi:hypothetical protein
MATIEEQVYTILSGISAITNLVPASRINVPGDWQNVTRPYIVHFGVTLEPTICHDGQKALRIWDFYQISVLADSYSQGNAVAVAIRDNFTGVLTGGVHVFFRPGTWYIGKDPDLGIHHFALNFRIGEALT